MRKTSLTSPTPTDLLAAFARIWRPVAVALALLLAWTPARGQSLLPPEAEVEIPFDSLDDQLTNVRGVNYIPGHAASSVAILNPQFADKLPQIELDLWNLRNAGVNTIRFWLNFWAWGTDPDWYISALQLVFARCEQWGIRVIPILWDALFEPCALGGAPTGCGPKDGCENYGCFYYSLIPNPDQQFYVWLPNPGGAYIFDQTRLQQWAPLFALYVNSVVTAVRESPALFLWDIMNEPVSGYAPLDLWLDAHIYQVRALDPNHGVTVGIALPMHQSQALVDQLDVLSFHPYAILKETYLDHLDEARMTAASAAGGPIPVLATEGLGGPGGGQRYEDYLRWVEEAECGFTLFEAMVHNAPYAYRQLTGFLYPDGTARVDADAVVAFKNLAQQQGGYYDPAPVGVTPAGPGAVPLAPLGQGCWAGVGPPEIVSLLRNWESQYGNPPYPSIVDATTANTYFGINLGVYADLSWLGLVAPAQQQIWLTSFAAFEQALEDSDWPAAEAAVFAMKNVNVASMPLGVIGNQQ